MSTTEIIASLYIVILKIIIAKLVLELRSIRRINLYFRQQLTAQAFEISGLKKSMQKLAAIIDEAYPE